MRSQLITAANIRTLANIQGRSVAGNLVLRVGELQMPFAYRDPGLHDGQDRHPEEPKPRKLSKALKRYSRTSAGCRETATATSGWSSPALAPIAAGAVGCGSWATSVRSGSCGVLS